MMHGSSLVGSWRTIRPERDRCATMLRQLYAGGEHTVTEIAKVLGVSRATIYRHLGSVSPRENVAAKAGLPDSGHVGLGRVGQVP